MRDIQRILEVSEVTPGKRTFQYDGDAIDKVLIPG